METLGYQEGFQFEVIDPEPAHAVCFFILSENEQYAEVMCSCGWKKMAGTVTELFEEYYKHRDVAGQIRDAW
jgi:hypothetical protein